MTLLKYADYMALVAHLTDTQAFTQYQQKVHALLQTFAKSNHSASMISRWSWYRVFNISGQTLTPVCPLDNILTVS